MRPWAASRSARVRPSLVVGVAGRGEAQRGAAADAFDAEELDDARVAELLEGPRFVAEPLGVLLVLGHLEHLGLGAARPAAQQRDRGRAAAEPALDLPAAVEHVALVGGERVDGRRLASLGVVGGRAR